MNIKEKIEKFCGWMDNNYGQDRLPLIPKVFPDDVVFKDRIKKLKKMYRSPDTHNIAIIGGVASGKSSLIKTFESQYIFPSCNFLNISIGAFLNSGKEITQDIIEQELVEQIFSHVHSSDLPALRHGVVKDKKEIPKLWCIFCPIIFGVGAMWYNYDQWCMLIPRIYVDRVRSFLCLFVIFCICIVMIHVISYSRKNLRGLSLGELKIKFPFLDIQLSGEKGINGCREEIIYALKKMRNQISHTVVFEDLELLDKDVCIDIFRKLKSLNRSLNNNILTYRFLSIVPFRQPIRFIYLFRNDLVHKIETEKFFEEIISLPDRLTVANVFDELKNKLKTEVKKGGYKQINIEDGLFPFDSDYIVNVSEYLTNTRTLNLIIKNYLTKWADFISNIENKTPAEQDPKHLFSFVLYEHFFPEDSKLFKNKTCIALKDYDESTDLEMIKERKELFVYLTKKCPEEYKVSECCMRFLGYMRDASEQ